MTAFKKHILVVGASSPFGSACAEIFSKDGHLVSLIGRPSGRALEPHTGPVHRYEHDLEQLHSIPSLFEQITKDRGCVSNLVFFQRYRGDGDKWAGEHAVSVRATQILIDLFGSQTTAHDDRSIVIATSPADAKVAYEQPLSYHAAKAALSQMVRYYAARLGHLNIRVNGVQPAIVLKPRTKAFFEKNPDLVALYKRIIPLGRLGIPEDIASVVRFLCGNDASFITGQILCVDGGLSVQENASLALLAAAEFNGNLQIPGKIQGGQMPVVSCADPSRESPCAPKIFWWRTHFGEEEVRRVAQAIENEHVSQGPVVKEFEDSLSRYLGVPYVVATTSGSMALLMALVSIGVGPGDEVIVPNRTWIATAHAPFLLGAKVRLVDVEADRPIIDAARIEGAITSRTKAIIPVHLNGRSADMREIRRLAQKHGLRVIEDAAQALGSRNQDGLLGTQSDMGCFSLSVAKIIATGQGGFVATRDAGLYEKLVAIRTHGAGNVIDAEWMQPGFNFRFTDILASIGLVQMSRLEERIKKVKEIYLRYVEAVSELPFLEFLPVSIETGEVPIYIEVLCKERGRLIGYLAEKGIQARPFYPDLNQANYFHNNARFPNSEKFGRYGIFLPCGPAQPLDSIDRVLDVLRTYMQHQ